jgi:hypothetical protein
MFQVILNVARKIQVILHKQNGGGRGDIHTWILRVILSEQHEYKQASKLVAKAEQAGQAFADALLRLPAAKSGN